VGNVFNLAQGQISFTLKSRYSFAQRQTSAAGQRYAFDVRDGNKRHQFYFLVQMLAGRLVFFYMIGGVSQYYYVPQGTEDQLFGSGASLDVSLKWDGSKASIYLNGTLAGSSAYVPADSHWNANSILDLGAYEYLNYGGFSSCDDLIRDFSVSSVN
jgi:hypothetical protein